MSKDKSLKPMAKKAKKTARPTVLATKNIKAKANNQASPTGKNAYKPSKPVNGVYTINQGNKAGNALGNTIYSEKNSAKLWNKTNADQQGKSVAKKTKAIKEANKKPKGVANKLSK